MSDYNIQPDFSINPYGIIPTSVHIAPESQESVQLACAWLARQTEYPRDTGYPIKPSTVDTFEVGGEMRQAEVVYTLSDIALYWMDTDVQGKGDIIAVRFPFTTPREVQAIAPRVPGAAQGPALARLFISTDDLLENPQVGR